MVGWEWGRSCRGGGGGGGVERERFGSWGGTQDGDTSRRAAWGM